MKMNKGRYNLRSLPGVRRGASGADAGCFSMRTIGGGELNRRASVSSVSSTGGTRAGVTAEQQTLHTPPSPTSTTSLFESPPTSPLSFLNRSRRSSTTTISSAELETDLEVTHEPTDFLTTMASPTDTDIDLSEPASTAEDVVQEASADKPAPAKAKTRARRKWTEDMNIFILRTYYIITKMETSTGAYLPELHAKFIEKFPDMDVSRQRVGDQRRAIVRSKLLTNEQIKTIQDEANRCLNNPSYVHSVRNSDMAGSQRMRWDNDLNEFIMKAYYRITEIETNKTAYRQPLHQAFITSFPHLSHISEQRIADQRRVIINNKLITTDRLQHIQDEIAIEITNNRVQTTFDTHTTPNTDIAYTPISNFDINETTADGTEISTPLTLHQIIQQVEHNNEELNVPDLPTDLQHQIEDTFLSLLTKYKTVDPIDRPFIPKQKTSRKFGSIVQFINLSVLPKHITDDTNFDTTQNIIFCAACTAAIHNGFKMTDGTTNNTRVWKKPIPKWKVRLQTRITDLRAKIGRLTAYINGNNSASLRREIDKIKTNYKIHSQHENENTELEHFLDTLKQKLSALSNRIRRYKETTRRKEQNTLFDNNEKLFYRNLSSPQTDNESQHTDMPETADLHQFWSNIWAKPITHRDNDWITEDKDQLIDVPEMTFEEITIDTLKAVLIKTHNWKATGSDKIHNYWYKKFSTIHPLLLTHINKFIKTPSTMPHYITTGITYMLPKDKNDLRNPAKYRPITCLQNIYKIITSCISSLIYKHVISQNILAEQQKGCRKGSLGCKEQLTIDAVISKQAIKKKRNIYTMYIDYKKAFDSVPHSWLIYILEHYKIHPRIVRFLQDAMLKWKTKLKLHNNNVCLETESIAIRRGIFQGDALSPLWFCLALNPLSKILNNSNNGYKLTYDNSHHKISHLLYMDDIKLYGNSLKQIHELARLTEMFSCDIGMEFGIDKCKIQSIQRGKIEKESYSLETGEIIEPVDEHSGYKYLGFAQTRQIHQRDTRKLLEQKFRSRLHKILNTHLNARNTIKAINTFAIPILTYSFGIIQWSKTNLIKLQRTINKLLTQNRKHHPRSCTERLTLPKLEGGRGLIDIRNLHNSQISSIRKFFHSQANNTELHKAVACADTHFTPLNLSQTVPQSNEKKITNQDKISSWLQKSLHGRHRRDLISPIVDKVASNMWLKRGELFPETEGFMLAIQDQTIHTLNYRKHIIKDHSLPSDLCRHCRHSPETIQHITGACSSITQTDYKHRHDQVAAIIHQYLALKHKLIRNKTPYYKYKPETILDSRDFKIYWDRTIITDKTVHYNRPDIMLHDKKKNTVYLIDIAVPNTHNLASTHSEKIAKYAELAIEIKSQWKVSTVRTIPIIVSTTGVIPHSLFKSLEALDIHKLTFMGLQKAAILNTCRIVRKFLSSDNQVPA